MRGLPAGPFTRSTHRCEADAAARPAHEHGYNVVVVEDATSAFSPEDQAFAFTRIFPRLGRVTSTAEAIEALRRP